MSGKEKKKGVWISLPALLAGLALIIAGALLLRQVPSRCEYALPAGFLAEEDAEPADPLKELAAALEGVRFAGAVRFQGRTIALENGEKISCTVYAVTEGYFDLRPRRLLSGRVISGEDLRGQQPVLILPDKLAQQLFPGQEPLNREITLMGKTCRVIGVLEQGGTLGEADSFLLWVPFSLPDKAQMGDGVLELVFDASRQEEKAAVRSALSAWRDGGAWIDGDRARLTALMPLWTMAAVAGLCLLRLLAGKAAGLIRRKAETLRTEAGERYAAGMIGPVLRHLLPPVLLLLLLAGCAWGWLRLAVLPLYTYTDWIPETPVDPASVSAALGRLAARSSAALRCQTALTAAGDWSRGLIAAGTVLFLTGLCARLAFRKKGGNS